RPAENSMLPATVRQGRSTGCWKTIPTSGNGSRTTVSRTRILPPLTGVSPATSLSNVDLPQPLGPTRVTNSFSAMSSVTSSSAGTRSPRRVREALEADQGPAGWAATALFLRRQEIVGVDLLERHLPLEAEILRVRVTRLLEPRRLELADRDRPFHDFLGVDEAAGHLRGAERAVGIDLGMVLHDVLHALV